MRAVLPRTPSSQSLLRRRIVEHMDNILDIIKPENKMIGLGWEVDVRRWLIDIIRTIARLEPAPPKRHGKVNSDIKRLQSTIRDLPEYASLKPALDRAFEESKRRAGAKGTRINKQQADLAARCAYVLLLEGGFGAPTLNEDGQYVRLTALIIDAATGRGSSEDIEGKVKTAARACSRHFKELQEDHLYGVPADEREAYKRESPYPYSRRRRRPSYRAGSAKHGEIDRLLQAHARKRVETARTDPTLDELLDEML
jgi:hypothetical protein